MFSFTKKVIIELSKEIRLWVSRGVLQVRRETRVDDKGFFKFVFN